jgi:hypothetical protein
MSRIRLHFDEDAMQQGLVVALRARRIDVLTPSDSTRSAPPATGGYSTASTSRTSACSTRDGSPQGGNTPESFSDFSSATLSVNNCGVCYTS